MDEYIGRKFKVRSKYGLSGWEDICTSCGINVYNVILDDDLKEVGMIHNIHVRGSQPHPYEFENVVWVD